MIEPQNVALPFVSIILPVRNEARFLRRSLGSVLSQEYPTDRVEVIVADGMSADGTRGIVEAFQRQYPHLRLINNPGLIVSTGLNAALRQARGEIIIRVDGHCEIERNYVRCCVRHLLEDRFDGVGGPLETVGETPIAKVIALAMASRFGVGNSAFRTASKTTDQADTIAFPAYTRTIIERIGPYDEELVRNQDDDYNYRLRRLGGKILLAADVRARYYSRSSLRSLWKQYFQYGYWKVRVMQKQPMQMRLRQFVPPLFAAALLVSSLAAFFSSDAGLILGSIVTCYAVSNLFASVVTAWKKGPLFAWALPIAFALIHLGYGFGFLLGLVVFRRRWRDRTRTYLGTWLPKNV
jgi:glycosyltransferase involved in cell wall biosynthesis